VVHLYIFGISHIFLWASYTNMDACLEARDRVLEHLTDDEFIAECLEFEKNR